LTKDKPRLTDTLEVIKYLCKDFWTYVFGKQIDNLRTNHRGVYVLQDNNFRWLHRFAAVPQGDPSLAAETHKLALSHLHLPCGIIRGDSFNCTMLVFPSSMM
ncbi:transport protein particle component, partial [Dunaliella salina]